LNSNFQSNDHPLDFVMIFKSALVAKEISVRKLSPLILFKIESVRLSISKSSKYEFDFAIYKYTKFQGEVSFVCTQVITHSISIIRVMAPGSVTR